MAKAVKKSIPFEFALEALEGLDYRTKPMFGAYGVYVGFKMVFILRDRDISPEDNGLWVPVRWEDQPEMKKKYFPNMRPIKMFEGSAATWQVLPVDSEDFEEAVLKICQMIQKEDPRIGTIPKKKLRSKKKKVAKKATQKVAKKK